MIKYFIGFVVLLFALNSNAQNESFPTNTDGAGGVSAACLGCLQARGNCNQVCGSNSEGSQIDEDRERQLQKHFDDEQARQERERQMQEHFDNIGNGDQQDPFSNGSEFEDLNASEEVNSVDPGNSNGANPEQGGQQNTQTGDSNERNTASTPAGGGNSGNSSGNSNQRGNGGGSSDSQANCQDQNYVRHNPTQCGYQQCADGNYSQNCDSSAASNNGDNSSNNNNSNAASSPEDDGVRAQIVKEQYSDLMQQCKEQRKQADTCCGDPVRCLAESGGAEDAKGVSGAVNTVYNIATQISMMNVKSANEMCRKMENLGLLGAGMNGAMGVYCGNNIKACKEVCTGIQSQIEMEKRNCEADPHCGTRTRMAYSEVYGSIKGLVQKCEDLKELEGQLYTQAASSGAGALLANKCKDATDVNTASTGFENPDSDIFNTDCSDPANASNPICQSQCQRPGAGNDPVCRQILGLDGGDNAGLANGAGDGEGGSGSGKNGGIESFGIDEEVASNQNFDGSAVQDKENSADVGNRSGGGIPGGGGGGGGGGGAPAPGGGGGNAGYNTNILKGFSGGNGYSTKIANRYSAEGGGFRGYGSGKPKNAGAKFNLKDYLPGGKKDARKRRIASVYGLSKNQEQQIGRMYENIFQKVSNRYYRICLKGMLYDCGDMFTKGK